MDGSAAEITVLLGQAHADRSAMDRLYGLIESRFRAMAQRLMKRERSDHTLEPTVLMDDAFVRLLADENPNWANREQFFCAAAKVMRRVLVDHARRRAAHKRGSGEADLPLDQQSDLAAKDATDPQKLVELNELVERLEVRHAHGLYGMPGVVSPQSLVLAIDSHAYITGHYALYAQQMVTQAPVAITCFTDRRSPRARQRSTSVGRLVFVCIRSSVYLPVPEGAVAPPPQALCDYVYLSRRYGVEPEALVTFRNLQQIRAEAFAPILPKYPGSVQKHVERLLHQR